MRKLLLILIICPLLGTAQPMTKLLRKQASTPVGGITFIGHVGIASPDGNSVTTGSLNTTGATLLVAAVSFYDAVSTSISDSKGNTWIPLTAKDNTDELVKTQLYYCYSGTVGSGHTFTISSGLASYPVIQVFAFGNTSGGFDVENGTVGGVSPVSTGAVTPATNGEVIISALGANYTSGLTSITSGFTNHDLSSVTSGSFFLSMGYYIQPTAGSQNCTFSWTASFGGNKGSAVIAAFK